MFFICKSSFINICGTYSLLYCFDVEACAEALAGPELFFCSYQPKF